MFVHICTRTRRQTFGRRATHPFSPFSPLTSIENMPKTLLCFCTGITHLSIMFIVLFLLPILYRLLFYSCFMNVNLTDEHCLKYKWFEIQGFCLCCVIFIDTSQSEMEQLCWTATTLWLSLSPQDKRGVFLVGCSQPKNPVEPGSCRRLLLGSFVSLVFPLVQRGSIQVLT